MADDWGGADNRVWIGDQRLCDWCGGYWEFHEMSKFNGMWVCPPCGGKLVDIGDAVESWNIL